MHMRWSESWFCTKVVWTRPAQKVRAMFHKGQKGRTGHWARISLHVARTRRARMALHDRAGRAWHCMSRGRAAQHAVRPTCRKVERGVTNVSGSARAVAPRTKIAVGRRRATAGGPLGGLFFVCVILSLSCLRGWINFLFATRWSTPFLWRS